MTTSTVRAGSASRSSAIDPPGDGREVHRPELHVQAPHACEREQRVDELAHGLRRGAHPLQVAAPLLRDDVTVAFQHREAEAVDGAQRRAQVVRHGVDELLQLPVGRVQLARALGDAALQAGVERPDLLLGALQLADVAGGGEHAGDAAVRVPIRGRVVEDGGDAPVSMPDLEWRSRGRRPRGTPARSPPWPCRAR